MVEQNTIAVPASVEPWKPEIPEATKSPQRRSAISVCPECGKRVGNAYIGKHREAIHGIPWKRKRRASPRSKRPRIGSRAHAQTASASDLFRALFTALEAEGNEALRMLNECLDGLEAVSAMKRKFKTYLIKSRHRLMKLQRRVSAEQSSDRAQDREE